MSALHSTAKANNDLSKRRRFQPPITKFFTNSSESASVYVSHDHYSARTFSPTPTVPAPVQSSLLSVGMRVRKSVAEGYKTHGPKINEKTTFPSYNPTATLHHDAGTTHTELSPFSGTLKLDSVNQAHPTTPAHGGMDYNHNTNQLVTDDGDAFSLPPSSQESAASFSTQPMVLKRSFGMDSAHDELDYESDSSTTLMSNNGHGMAPTAGRTILLPKLGQQRRRFIAVQEQRTMDIDDFDEPAFLRRREEVDMDYIPGCDNGYEIRMGGL